MMLRRPNRSYRVAALAVIMLAVATCRLAAQEHKGAEPAPPAAGHQAATPAHDAGHGDSEESSNPLKTEGREQRQRKLDTKEELKRSRRRPDDAESETGGADEATHMAFE